jgi:archaellum component FlaC
MHGCDKMNPPRDDSQRESVHDIVQRETAGIRTDVENLERLYTSMQEKTNDSSYEIRRAKEILEQLGERVENLEKGVKKLTETFSDIRLMRFLVYGAAAAVFTAVVTWLQSKIPGMRP